MDQPADAPEPPPPNQEGEDDGTDDKDCDRYSQELTQFIGISLAVKKGILGHKCENIPTREMK